VTVYTGSTCTGFVFDFRHSGGSQIRYFCETAPPQKTAFLPLTVNLGASRFRSYSV
jgi:hypothetical protein